jgi:PhzF family phenazine biosynthesis protein
MSLELKVIDAFTDKPFSGNPAAVIILPDDHPYPYETLLGIAAEFNLSETAYITIPKKHDVTNDGCPIFGLRWFIPTQEIKLCGHATLASASVIFTDKKLVPNNVHQIQFSTLAGILTARRILSESGGAPWFEIELPASNIDQACEEVVKKAREVVSRATSADICVQYVGVCGSTTYEWYMLIEIDGKMPLKGMKVNSGVLVRYLPSLVTRVKIELRLYRSGRIASCGHSMSSNRSVG